MNARSLLALSMTVAVVFTAAVAAQPPTQKPDPLKEAADILKALGPPPIAPQPAQVVKKHVLLEAPTVWYWHGYEQGKIGLSHSWCQYELLVLYPDGTFGFYYRPGGSVGAHEVEYADPSYFLNRDALRVGLLYAGKWEPTDDGEVRLKTEQIPAWRKRSSDYRREDYTTGRYSSKQLWYATEALLMNKSERSKHDYSKGVFYPNHFGNTVAEAQGGKDLEKP